MICDTSFGYDINEILIVVACILMSLFSLNFIGFSQNCRVHQEKSVLTCTVSLYRLRLLYISINAQYFKALIHLTILHKQGVETRLFYLQNYSTEILHYDQFIVVFGQQLLISLAFNLKVKVEL